MDISIVVPAYNAEKTIADCINSLLKQTKKAKEIIVVDDASSDNTAEIVKKIAKRHKEVKLISLKENSGPARARNIGARKAKGEIIVFVDADCVAKENFLEEITKQIEEGKAIGVQGAYKTKQKSTVAKFSQIEIEYRYAKMLSEQRKKGSVDFIGSYAAAFKKEI
ncbi:MAG: glycosyltransferase family 2 protein, partial [Candidatus Diapherotrites archaeon]|nr:glycosyltransferase family 2 protein [Candidatus Diapherotrites archaeon]